VDWTSAISNLSIALEVPAGGVDVHFLPDVSHDVSIYGTAWGKRGATYTDPVVTNETVGSTGSLRLATESTGNIFWGLRIDINTSLATSLAIDTSAAGINIIVPNGAVLNFLNATADAGGINVEIKTGATIAGDIQLATTAGAIKLEASDPTISRNIDVDVSTNVGAADIGWNQTTCTGGNVTLSASSNGAGAVNFEMRYGSSVGAQVTASKGSAIAVIDPSPFQQSANWNTASCRFTVDFFVQVGVIHYEMQAA
jgi:hypothetical protein